MRKVTKTDIYDSEGNFLFTQTLMSYTDDDLYDREDALEGWD